MKKLKEAILKNLQIDNIQKEKIKNFIIHNNFYRTPKNKNDSGFNGNLLRISTMRNTYGDFGVFILEKFLFFKETFLIPYSKPSFSEFLKVLFLETSNNIIGFLDTDTLDLFLKNNFNNDYKKAIAILKNRPNFCLFLSKKFKKELDFLKLDDIREYCYIKLHNIKERPICKMCKGKIEFQNTSDGFRDFCSHYCQLAFRNAKKEVKFSKLTDDEIREIITKIPFDVRNLATKEVAENFLNIMEYSKDLPFLTESERLYLFMNKCSLDEPYCRFCGDKKKFQSQAVGYNLTCGKEKCKHASAGKVSNINEFRGKGGWSFPNTFVYILQSVSKPSLCKIGISTNPLERLKDIKNVSKIDDLELIFSMYKKNGIELERKLHKKFKTKQHKFDYPFQSSSEFFLLDENDIKQIQTEIIKW